MVQGSIVAVVTPFDDSLNVDYNALTDLLEWHVAQKTDGIVILGTTGEAPTLSKEEKLKVFKHTVKVIDGRIPVIAGTGSNNTMETVAFSRQVEELGVDGLLVVTPYYNKGNNKGLIKHYQLINDSVNIPIIVYNVPSRTGLLLPLEVIKVIMDFDNIVGIKEASGDLSYFASVKNIVRDDFLLYSGNDDVILPSLSLGASGVISVVANVIPYECSLMVHSYLAGDTEKATKLQLHYMDLIHSLFVEVNPIPVKKLLDLMGKQVGGFRLPLCEPEESTVDLLNSMKDRYQL
jgi:4-hydroxy-tetrahydrodipicolinate synthase